MNCGIYTITSFLGDQYVGSSANIARRWIRHQKGLQNGDHGNRILQRAWNKYGADSFEFEKLLICSPENLLFFEQQAMDVLKPKYNITLTAGSQLGVKRSVETKSKMSLAQKNRLPPSLETRAKIGAASVGRIQSAASLAQRSATLKKTMATPESKAKMCNAAQRRAQNTEISKKISVALTGIVRSEETKMRMSVAQTGHPSTTKGIPRSDEVKAKISAANTGKVRSPEGLANIREACRLRELRRARGK